MKSAPAIQPGDRFVREAERRQITQISRTTAWSMERKGLFPKRRRLNEHGHAVAWLLSELNAWVASREMVGGEA
ncbi:helix-turn-helix transcriptional regulator [Shewanella algae]|uniref:helix-turn-helix transcriptional regulator n=1 Tax=Shewanella algae TaxID=38313 RepID=UPI0031F57F12